MLSTGEKEIQRMRLDPASLSAELSRSLLDLPFVGPHRALDERAKLIRRESWLPGILPFPHSAAQFSLEASKIPNCLPNVLQMPLGEIDDTAARTRAARPHAQDFADFLQGEAERLRLANE